MDIRRIVSRWTVLLSGILLLGSFDSSSGQTMYQENESPLLFKPEMDREFYGRAGYNKYGRSIVNRSANPKYDNFGNYLLDGVRIFEWNEEKINSKHVERNERFSRMYKTNPIDEGEYFRQYLNNLVVVHETTKTFSTRFIVGNEVRAKFSPLTLDMAALNGVRWDMNFYDTNMTFVSSRADIPLWFSRDFVNDEDRFRQMPVYLTGGHFEKKFGVFNVAANYVNQYKTDSTQARRFSNKTISSDIRDSVTGQISFDPEKVLMLVVKLEDGSRWDDGGPRIYDIVPIIEGVEHPELLVGITTESWNEDFSDVRRLFNNPAVDFYENRYMLEPRRVPQFVVFDQHDKSKLPDNVLMRRFDSDKASAKSFDQYAREATLDNKRYLECNGMKYLQFWFEMPTKVVTDDSGTETIINVENVEFKSLVSNDYKFSISEIYYDENQARNGKKGATYFYVAAEEPGNVKDESNLGWIRFKYGQQTADMLLGFRVDANIKGFDFVAEYNKNLNWRQFPNVDSEKFREDAEAYYINLKKEFGKFTFGTEYFKIAPNYMTTMLNMDRSYYYMNTLPYSSWANEFDADIGLRGGGSSSVSSSASEYMNNTMVLETVDDNDDKDRFPDFHMFSDVRDRDGIYPGLDRNGNARPDTNENGNLIPDYMEPFFLFNVDPDEYDYGDDFNQNGVIDSREDDDQPDYPYDKDTQGYHVFGSYGANLGWKFMLGFINFEQIAGGGKTDVRYVKAGYRKFIPFFATINMESSFKKAEDSIQDDIFRHATQLAPATLRDSLTYEDNIFYSREGIQHEKYYDPLLYRDSYISTSYFETNLFRIPNLTIGIKLKYDLNHQNKTSYQKTNQIIDRTQVLKADYKLYVRKLLLEPQVKFLSRKMGFSNTYYKTLHMQYFYPIFRIEYPITYNTTLKAGAQGFPFLNSTVRNLVNSELDYDTRDYLIMLTNRSLYNGYDFSLNFGYQMSWQKLKGIVRAPYSTTDNILFIRLIVGMEPIS